MNRKLKIFSGFLIITILPCLIYYSAKFYISKTITFNSTYLLGWTILVSLIVLSLALNCYIISKLSKQQKYSERLEQLILGLSNQNETNHYSTLEYNQGTREIILDGFDERG